MWVDFQGAGSGKALAASAVKQFIKLHEKLMQVQRRWRYWRRIGDPRVAPAVVRED